MAAENQDPDREVSDEDVSKLVSALHDVDAIGRVPLSQWLQDTQQDLRRIAHSERKSLNAGMTMSTTALISEAYLRFAQSDSQFIDRKHFFATCARAMRQILLDYARTQQAQKRGSVAIHESLDAALHAPAAVADPADILALERALEALGSVMPRAARVVELRYFVGLDDREAGEILGVEESTVRRDWLKARAWLLLHLGDS